MSTKVPKVRLDELLVERGLAASQSKAKLLILAGSVFCDSNCLDKPGKKVPIDLQLRLAESMPFVSRAGEKLDAALSKFAIDVRGLTCLDIGASTGGFTDCLLKRGAVKVIALDVGRNLIDWSLRNDPRVRLLEERNARYLTSEWYGKETVDLVTVDVSFISVTKLCDSLWNLQLKPFFLSLLIKPQFEVGKGKVGKGGIVRDAGERQRVVSDVCRIYVERGFELRQVCDDILKGAKGNQETMTFFHKPDQK